MPGHSAHGTIDDLQLVFPEIGYAADRPKKRSARKAVATTYHANPGPGECSERKAGAATYRVNPGPECSEQKAAATTNHADPGLIYTRPQNSTDATRARSRRSNSHIVAAAIPKRLELLVKVRPKVLRELLGCSW